MVLFKKSTMKNKPDQLRQKPLKIFIESVKNEHSIVNFSIVFRSEAIPSQSRYPERYPAQIQFLEVQASPQKRRVECPYRR